MFMHIHPYRYSTYISIRHLHSNHSMFSCVTIHIYTYTQQQYIHEIHTQKYFYTYTPIYTHTQPRYTHSHTHILTHTHTHTSHTNKYTYTHIYIHIHKYVIHFSLSILPIASILSFSYCILSILHYYYVVWYAQLVSRCRHLVCGSMCIGYHVYVFFVYVIHYHTHTRDDIFTDAHISHHYWCFWYGRHMLVTCIFLGYPMVF